MELGEACDQWADGAPKPAFNIRCLLLGHRWTLRLDWDGTYFQGKYGPARSHYPYDWCPRCDRTKPYDASQSS